MVGVGRVPIAVPGLRCNSCGCGVPPSTSKVTNTVFTGLNLILIYEFKVLLEISVVRYLKVSVNVIVSFGCIVSP